MNLELFPEDIRPHIIPKPEGELFYRCLGCSAEFSSMRTPNGKYTGVVGEILEIDPPYKYSMTFKFTNFNDAVCKVTHELKEVEGGTEFTLISEGVPVGTKTEKNMSGGGKIITTTLKSCVETGKPTFMASFIMVMGKLFGFMSPRQSLSTNWPMDKRIRMDAD